MVRPILTREEILQLEQREKKERDSIEQKKRALKKEEERIAKLKRDKEDYKESYLDDVIKAKIKRQGPHIVLQWMFNRLDHYKDVTGDVDDVYRQKHYKRMEAVIALVDNFYSKKLESEIKEKPVLTKYDKENPTKLAEYYKGTYNKKSIEEKFIPGKIDRYIEAMKTLQLMIEKPGNPNVYELNPKNHEDLLECYKDQSMVVAVNLKTQFEYLAKKIEEDPKFKISKDRRDIISNFMMSIIQNPTDTKFYENKKVVKNYLDHVIKEHLNKKHEGKVKLTLKKFIGSILDKIHPKRVTVRNQRHDRVKEILAVSSIDIPNLLEHILPTEVKITDPNSVAKESSHETLAMDVAKEIKAGSIVDDPNIQVHKTSAHNVKERISFEPSKVRTNK